ncbi:MAG TPA: hypothetical protein VK529_11675 [Gemmatimonadaceae bacterium]|jgi:hypothetical protein|nr:hypothetical protein [Gemmatimonadaceae bacterium]
MGSERLGREVVTSNSEMTADALIEVLAGIRGAGIDVWLDGNGASGYVPARTQLTDRPFLVLPFFVSLERAR